MNKSSTDGDGHTPLALASRDGKVDVVRVLLEAGADVNKSTTGGDGHTPLTFASVYGEVEVARVLLEAGADMNKRNSEGRSPLYLSLKVVFWHPEQRNQGKAKVAALLHEAGAQEPTAFELQQMEQEIAQEIAQFNEMVVEMIAGGQMEQEIAQPNSDFEGMI